MVKAAKDSSFRKGSASNKDGTKVQHHVIALFADQKRDLKERIGRVQKAMEIDRRLWEHTSEAVIAKAPELREITARSDRAKRNLERMNATLDRVSTYPRVTEHAMLRYCERILGVDVVRIGRNLLPATAAAHVHRAKAAGRIVVEGMDSRYVVAHGEGFIASVWPCGNGGPEEAALPVFRFTAAELWRQLLEEREAV